MLSFPMLEKELERKFDFSMPAIAVGVGLVDSARYAHVLRVSPSELKRYLKKTTNLAMCYVGFAQDPFVDQAKGAGHAAFLSCAYDLVTDWGKSPRLQQSYEGILRIETSPELTDMALTLLNRDVNGVLLDDGLERGVVATELILQMMGIKEEFRRKCNVKELGVNLQIVDDVIDFESDIIQGDQNCLANVDRREEYLSRLQNDFDNSTLSRLFPYGGILTHAIKMARRKGEDMQTYPERYF